MASKVLSFSPKDTNKKKSRTFRNVSGLCLTQYSWLSESLGTATSANRLLALVEEEAACMCSHRWYG